MCIAEAVYPPSNEEGWSVTLRTPLMTRFALLALSLLATTPAAAQPFPAEDVPEALAPWVPWVLDGDRTYGCTFLGEQQVCTWPGELRLTLDATSGRFELDVVADRQADVALPGGSDHFPRGVRVDGTPQPVLDGPVVRVGPGAHRIEGAFRWTSRPDLLPVPPSVARVALVLDGATVRSPRREESGAVWLAGPTEVEGGEGHFEMEVFRRIDDGVPFRVTTRLEVRASGQPREMQLGQVVLPGMIATDVSSDLAVRIASDGTASAQVHAGSFYVEVRSVAASPPESLQPAEQAAPWPASEVWVWAADESLRQVELEGAPSVEPSRTNLPEAWRDFPAYVLRPEHTLTFTTMRRGEPMPPPNRITLAREMWLDLDGQGYTVRDTLSGEMRHGHRLDLSEGQLGRAIVSGQDQLVTSLDDRNGIELRARAVDVRAEWRLADASNELPAVGWSEDVQSLSTTVRLPPGYSLLAATGVDRASGTWITQWDLWSLFFVLLATVAVGRLFGWRGMAVTLPMLVLCHHESVVPLAWAVTLAGIGGLRLAWTKGTFGPRFVRGAYWAVLGIFVLMAAPFASDQAKLALFPHTQARHGSSSMGLTLGMEEDSMASMPPEAEAEDVSPVINQRLRNFGYATQSTASSDRRPSAGWFDPNEKIQTGPGVPDWSFHTWSLAWSGPVAQDHRIQLWLLTPWMNRLLALARILLLGAFIVLVLRRKFPKLGGAIPAGVTALATLALLVGAPSLADAQSIPDDARLEQLRTRLTRPPECVPSCVVASSLEVRVRDEHVTLEALVHAGTRAAYRVPGPAAAWVPTTVTVDGRPDTGLVRSADGFLFLRLEPGVHRVVLDGPIPARDSLTLAFGEPPRSIELDADGWEVEGVRANGRASETIELRRTVRSEHDDDADQLPLASWLTVTRRLDIGVRWTLRTTVERVTPAGAAVVARVPLLDGESVTDADMMTEGGEVVVTLGRDDTHRTWTSVIEPRETLVLSAPEGARWSEIWTLACSPIWRCTTEGLDAVSHDAGGPWEPTFRPWPGEQLTMRFVRPEAAEGQSITIDQATITWRPGVRMLDATLEADLRTSSGGTQVLTLPDGARVQSLTVRGTPRPVQLEDGNLRVTLQPGSQNIAVAWQQPAELGAFFSPPEVGLGAPAVNARVRVELPDDRWLLWTSGPAWGTVVLFWPYLALLLVIAVALGRVRHSPLSVWAWALLGLGLTQLPWFPALFVALWFFAFEHRSRTPELAPGWFDLRQLGLVFHTFIALCCLLVALHAGLLGAPDMELHSPENGHRLSWYTDRINGSMPDVTVVSLPMWIWRVTMLAWALWLAVGMIKWARWAFRAFTEGGGWKKLSLAASSDPALDEPATQPTAPPEEEPKP